MWFWENTQTPSFSKTWTVVNGGIITQVKRKEHDGPPPCSGGWGEVTGDHLAFQGGSSPTHPRTHIRSRYSRGAHTVGDYIPRPLGTCVVSRDSLVMGAGMSELWWVRRAIDIIVKRMDFFWRNALEGRKLQSCDRLSRAGNSDIHRWAGSSTSNF